MLLISLKKTCCRTIYALPLLSGTLPELPCTLPDLHSAPATPAAPPEY